jgi:hypothetical protein
MRATLLDSAAGRFLDGEGTTHSARLGDTLAAGGMRVSVYGAQLLLGALFRLAPGAAEFLVRPRPGALTEAEGTVPSVRGPVKVAVHRSTDAHTTRVTVPPNSRAVLEVEIGDADPAQYRVTAKAPGGQGPMEVTPLTDLTGTVLTTKVERTRS